jgi:phosphatidyl-myo-inositol dimannoside synthase
MLTHPRERSPDALMRHPEGVLGLFSGCTALGGVQASGRLAWEAILAADGAFGTPSLFCYGDNGPNDPTITHGFHTDSRGRAILAALGGRRRAGLVLVWHMRLLKLVPLFRMPGARVVLFLHGVEAWRPLSWLERRLLRRVDLFLSNSEFTWRHFVEIHPEWAGAAHRTVPLGIGDPCAGSSPEPQAPPVALMVSRLAKDEDYKGHRELLEAWPLVQQRVPDAELWIAGDGDLRPELERRAADRGLRDAVRCVGRVSEQSKQALIGRSRCMVLPSRGEGFGLAYAEAMRLGRPCLVSTLDAGREVVDPPRHGLAVDPADPPAVAEAVCRLLTDGPDWQQWSRLARERYERQFTASHFRQRLVSSLTSTPPAAAPALS